MSTGATQRRLAAILAADVVGYSQDKGGTLATLDRRHKSLRVLLAFLLRFYAACIGLIIFALIDTAAALEQSRLDEIRKKFGVPAIGYAVIYDGESETKVSGSRIVGQ